MATPGFLARDISLSVVSRLVNFYDEQPMTCHRYDYRLRTPDEGRDAAIDLMVPIVTRMAQPEEWALRATTGEESSPVHEPAGDVFDHVRVLSSYLSRAWWFLRFWIGQGRAPKRAVRLDW